MTKFTTEANGGKDGLKAEFFDNSTLSGKPGIDACGPEGQLRPGATGGMAANDISIRWTGYFTPAHSGDYLAFVQGPGENGGYRLYIDKKMVIDDWTQAYAFLSQLKISLPSGPHQIQSRILCAKGLGQDRN